MIISASRDDFITQFIEPSARLVIAIFGGADDIEEKAAVLGFRNSERIDDIFAVYQMIPRTTLSIELKSGTMGDAQL